MKDSSTKINIITRCSRKDKFLKTLNSLNNQKYSNLTHYITYQNDDMYNFLNEIDFTHNTILVRVPNLKKIKNLNIMYELDDVSVDYLNPDWEFIERRVVTNIDEFEVEKNNNKNRKQVESQIYEKNGFWCTSLDHTLLRMSTHFPYNLYIKIVEQNIDNGWILYLDDDDTVIDENKLLNLVNEIEKYDEDTIHIFKMKREPNTVPSDKFFKYMETGHPVLYGEIGSSCICFHSKYKDYTMWDEWSNADYRTVKVLEKVIPNKNFFDEVIIDASKSGQISE